VHRAADSSIHASVSSTVSQLLCVSTFECCVVSCRLLTSVVCCTAAKVHSRQGFVKLIRLRLRQRSGQTVLPGWPCSLLWCSNGCWRCCWQAVFAAMMFQCASTSTTLQHLARRVAVGHNTWLSCSCAAHDRCVDRAGPGSTECAALCGRKLLPSASQQQQAAGHHI
jgi:hypothetical protein